MYDIIKELKDLSYTETASYIVQTLIDKIHYIDYINETYDDAEARIENIDEFKNSILELENVVGELRLNEYLENVSLVSATDDLEEKSDYIKLMTIHNSKGLEFPIVFLVGFENEIFPGARAMLDEKELEEERRLCYVAVTRAKKELYISHVSERMVWGQMNYMIKPSRFIYEMKQGNLEYLSEKFKSFSKKMENATVVNKETRRKIENFNPFSLKSVRTSELKNKGKSKYKVGDTVNHIKFGKGKIKKVDEKSLVIDFMTGEKKIALILAEKLLKG